jgi:hypothetical protein
VIATVVLGGLLGGLVAPATIPVAQAATVPTRPTPGPTPTLTEASRPARAVPGARELYDLRAARVTEASGLAVAPDGSAHFTVEDAGKPAEIVVLDPGGGPVRGRIRVPFPNVDWEDLAITAFADGTTELAIADTGDAYAATSRVGEPARTEYALIRMRLPDPLPARGEVLDVEGATSYRLTYPETVGTTTPNSETLLVNPANHRVYVVDKLGRSGAADAPLPAAGVWAAPAVLSSRSANPLRQVARVPIVGASGGAFSLSGTRVAIRDQTTAYVWKVEDGDLLAALANDPVEVPLPAQKQGEGIAFSPDGKSLLVNSESRVAPTWQVDLPADLHDEQALVAAPIQIRDRRPLIVLATCVGLLALLLGRLAVRRR